MSRSAPRHSAKRDILAALPLFEGCSTKELRHIESLVDEVDVRPGHRLTVQGETGREAFVLVSGEAEVVVDGRAVTRLGSGAVVGEMSLLERPAPRTATVTATTAATVLVLDPRSFSALLDAHPSVARQVEATRAERLRSAEASTAA